MKFLLYLFTSFIFLSAQSTEQTKPEVILGEDRRLVTNGEDDYLENKYVYIIEGDIVIERGGKLTIEPGTTLKFRPKTDVNAGGKSKHKAEIIVRGELIAEGEPGSEGMIVMTSAANMADRRAGDWFGIVFYKNKDNKSSRVIHTQIEYATKAINCIGSNTMIVNNFINYNSESGLYLSARTEAVVAFNTIHDNSYAAVEVRYDAKPKLYSNIIMRNPYGIMIYDNSQPQLGSSSGREVLIGEDYLKGENILSGRNAFFDNDFYHIYNLSNQAISAQNNSFDTYRSTRAVRNIRTKIYDSNNKSASGAVNINTIRSRLKYEDFYASRKRTQNQIEALKDQKSRINKFLNTINIRSTPNSGNVITGTNGDEVAAIDTVTVDTNQSNLSTLLSNISQVTKQDPLAEFYLDPGSGQLVTLPEPVYAGAARADNIEGKVRLKLSVDLNGKVREAYVVDSDNLALNQLAINDSDKIIYSPGYFSGQRVYFYTTILIEYKADQ